MESRDLNLDYSVFHPLDHPPGTYRCRSLHGGIWNHIRLAWEYRYKDRLLAPLYWVSCHLGRHDFHLWYNGDFNLGGCYCFRCSAQREPTEEERRSRPTLFS